MTSINGGLTDIYMGNGDGTFEKTSTLDSGNASGCAAIADFNDDDIQDLAVVSRGDNKVNILLGVGDGTFQWKKPHDAGARPYWVAAGDFSADGMLDLAVVSRDDNALSVYIGNGNGTFGARTPYDTGLSPRAVSTGDFDGDGTLDLAVAAGQLCIHGGNGDGTFQEKVSYATGSGARCVTAGDFNRDGAQDLAVASESDDRLNIHLGALAPPTLTSIDPVASMVEGGGAFTVTGTNFSPRAALKIGETVVDGITVESATTITGTIPAGTEGVYDVTVTNPDTQTATLEDAFTYDGTAATLASSNPPNGSIVQSLDTIVFTLTDNYGVDEAATEITATRNGAPFTTFDRDDSVENTITLTLHGAKGLAGLYSFAVTPHDVVGNVGTPAHVHVRDTDQTGPKTYYVDASASCDHSAAHATDPTTPACTITEVVTSPSIGEGDVVQVAAGAYAPSTNGEAFPITIDHGLILRGAGRDDTILDAEETNRVIIGIHGRVESLTVRGGNAGGSDGGGIYARTGVSFWVEDCAIVENSARAGGGVYCGGTLPITIANCLVRANRTVSSDGGGIHCSGNSHVVITECMIVGNASAHTGAGVLCGGSNVTIRRSTIMDNEADDAGGGIQFSGGSGAVLASSIVAGNLARAIGGGIDCWYSHPEIVNCTITDNEAEGGGGGGGVCLSYSSAKVANSILWSNRASTSIEVGLIGGSTIELTYSVVQGGWAGAGNFDADPGLADVANDDFHLLPGSPCLNSGTNLAVSGLPRDIDGEHRILNGLVDIGADERDLGGSAEDVVVASTAGTASVFAIADGAHQFDFGLLPTDGESMAIARAGADVVWLANENTSVVTRAAGVDYADVTTHDVFVYRSRGICVDTTNHVWVTHYYRGEVTKLDPNGQIAAGFPVAVGTHPRGIAADRHGNVWVANEGDNSVQRLDSQGNVLATTDVGGEPYYLAVDFGRNVWVTNHGDGTVTKLDPAGTLLGTYGVGGGPTGVAVDAYGNVWVSNTADGTVSKLDSQGNPLLGGPVAVGVGPRGIAADNTGHVWVACTGESKVYRLTQDGAKDPAGGHVIGNAPHSYGDWTGFVYDSTVYDRSAPSAPGTPTDGGALSASTTVTFDWTAATERDGVIVGYHLQVGTTPGGTEKLDSFVDDVLTYDVTAAHGETLYARVRARNLSGVYGPWSGNSDGILIDVEGPTLVSRTPSAAWVQDLPDVTLELTDDRGAGAIDMSATLDTLVAKLNGQTLTEGTNYEVIDHGGGQIEILITEPANGLYEAALTAEDDLGNTRLIEFSIFDNRSGSPLLEELSPPDEAVHVDVDANVVATFSECIDPATVTSESFSVANGGPVGGTFDVSYSVVTFTPTGGFESGLTYTVRIDGSDTDHPVTDRAGEPLPGGVETTFSTGQGPEISNLSYPSTRESDLPIEVCADISDATTGGEGVSGATLYYGYSSPYNQLQAVGRGPGGNGDGEWCFTIPPQGDGHEGQMLRFYVAARDGSPTHNETIDDNEGAYYAVAILDEDTAAPFFSNNQPLVAYPGRAFHLEVDITDAKSSITDDPSATSSVCLRWDTDADPTGSGLNLDMDLVSGNTYRSDAQIGPFIEGTRITWQVYAADNDNTPAATWSQLFTTQIADQVGPVIGAPVFPATTPSDESVDAVVNISDVTTGDSGVSSAKLFYGYVGPNYDHFQVIGTGPGGKGDGQWRFTIPPQLDLNEGRTLKFSVVARDGTAAQNASTNLNGGAFFAMGIEDDDTAAPTFANQAPTTAAPDEEVTFQLDISDAESGIVDTPGDRDSVCLRWDTDGNPADSDQYLDMNRTTGHRYHAAAAIGPFAEGTTVSWQAYASDDDNSPEAAWSSVYAVTIEDKLGPAIGVPSYFGSARSDEEIEVSVDISDAERGGSGVSTARLFYGYAIPAPHSVLGTGPGGNGDGEWQFTIPAQGDDTEGRTLKFYFEARDDALTPNHTVEDNGGNGFSVNITDDDTAPPVFSNHSPTVAAWDEAFHLQVDIVDEGSGVVDDDHAEHSVCVQWDTDGDPTDSPSYLDMNPTSGDTFRSVSPLGPFLRGTTVTWRAKARDDDNSPEERWSGNFEVLIPAEIVLHGPTSIVLGETLDISGRTVPPRPREWLDLVFERDLPGAGFVEVDRFSILADLNGEFRLSPSYRPESPGQWRIGAEAEWGLASDRTLTVAKAELEIVLNESVHAVALGEPLDVTGYAQFAGSDPQAIPEALVGLGLSLIVTAPDGSQLDPIAGSTLAHGNFVFEDVLLDQKGTWTLAVEFDGDDSFKEGSSNIITIDVRESAGHAIIVVGRVPSGAGLEAHLVTGDRVYRTLLARGFERDNIRYFRYCADPDCSDGDCSDSGCSAKTVKPDDVEVYGPPRKDGAADEKNIADTITTWARDQINRAPAPLYVILLDHGGIDQFYIYNEATHEDVTISPQDLNSWFTQLDAGLTSDEARLQARVIIYGACHSGSFIGPLSHPSRVVIASCTTEEQSFKGPYDPAAGVRDGEYFISQFFRAAEQGNDLKRSFETAVRYIESYTQNESGNGGLLGAVDGAAQHPMLDDNGDGQGANDGLAYVVGEEGSQAGRITLGFDPFNPPDALRLVQVGATVYLPALTATKAGEKAADPLWVEVNDPARVAQAWIEIKHPDFDLPPPTAATEQREITMPRIDGNPADYEGKHLRWPDFDEGGEFDDPGTYEVFYYAKDKVTGDLVPFLMSRVVRQVEDNQGPTAFDLLEPDEPAGGESYETPVILDWEDSTDPDASGGSEDDVTYQVEFADDAAFGEADIVHTEDGVDASHFVIEAELVDGGDLPENTDLWWRVAAVDFYGAKTFSTSTRKIRVKSTNSTDSGWVMGVVADAVTGDRIHRALVQVGTGAATETNRKGAYLKPTLEGTYTVTASATGYQTQVQEDVDVKVGKGTTVNFFLDPYLIDIVEPNVEVPEGGQTTFLVELNAQPDENVTVTVTNVGGDGDITVDAKASVTLTPLTWDDGQPVTVTAGEDVDAINGTATLRCSADGWHSAEITVTERDNDVRITADPTVSVPEGGQATFAVKLGGTPDSDVTVTVTRQSGDGDLALASKPATLTFTPAEWNTAKTVTITAAEDDDALDGTATFQCSAPGWEGAAVTATEQDSDVAGFTVTETNGSTQVAESGTTDTFTVSLNAQPASNVVFDVKSGDSGEATASPASLTFGPGTWDTPQTVTVKGVDDARVDGTQTTTVTVSVDDINSDDGFDDVPDQTVSVTTTDNDVAGVTVNPTSGLSTTEAGGKATFTVVLHSEPAANVTIGLSSSDATEGTVSPSSLTFAAANWDTKQTVTVTGVNDDVDDGNIGYTVTTGAANSTDPNYSGLNPPDVSVTNQDNDTAGVTVNPTSGLTTTEVGGTVTLTVVLDTEPTANVTIGLSSSDATEGTVSPSSLTFTAGNWDTTQTVTVTGVDDDADDGNIDYAVTTAAASSTDANYNGLNPPDVSVTNQDNDTAGVTVNPTSGLTTTEVGGTVTLTVVLDTEPTANVTIGLSSSDATEGTVSPSSLTFTAGNWDTTQTVTVTGVDDDADDGNIDYAVTTAAASSTDANYNGLNPPDVSVTNQDNDTAGVTVNPTSGLMTTEVGGTVTFTVVLDTQPTANVTIGLSSSDTTEGTVSPASLTFTPANWDTEQTVTVTGVDDDEDDGNRGYTVVTATASSGDTNYNGLDPADVSVTNQDNDTAGVTVNPTSGLTTTEAGGTATFTVALNTEPTVDVTIGLSSSDTTEGTISPSSLTFTAAKWDFKQMITVTGVDDDGDDGDIGYTVVTAAAKSSDINYNGLDPDDVLVTNEDDDVAGVTADPTDGLTTTEAGGMATFTVVLNTEPTANVTIGLSSSDTTEGTVSPSSLTFTSANWGVARSATVTGVDDDADDGDIAYMVTAAASSSDANYNSPDPLDVSLTNQDDDVAGVTVSPTSGLTTTEAAGTATFTVVLHTQPTADVTIGLSSTDTTEGTVSPSDLTFTAGDWDTVQSVTLTGIDDDVDDGNIGYTVVTAAVTSSDANYNDLNPADVSVTNEDDDVAGVTVDPASGLTTTEAGGTATFTVVLDTKPTASVTIDLSSSDATEGTVSPSSLTFTPANWDAKQTVTVTGVDDDADDGNIGYTVVTAAASSSDGDYNGLDPADVSVTNRDNDITLTVQSTEGGTTDPSGSVIVDTDDEMPFDIHAIPDSGRAFDYWTESVPGSVADTEAADTTVTATEGVTVTAYFRSVYYYVNDGSTEWDVWCTDVGDAANPGTSPDTPLDSVQAVLDAYGLEPGDTLYIDAGVYDLSAPILIGAEDSGTAAEPVLLQGVGGQGSCGSSLLRLGSAEAGIRVQGATGITIRGVTCEGVGKAEASGIEVLDSMWVTLAQNQLYGNGTAILAELSGNVLIASNFIYGNRQMGIQVTDSVDVTDVIHNTLHANQCDLAVVGTCADVSVLYNMLWADGRGRAGTCECFSVEAPSQSTFLSNYNDVCASRKAIAGHWGEQKCKKLKHWQTASGQDEDSVSVAPAVRNAKTSKLEDRDYHLTSRAKKLIDQLGDGVWFPPAFPGLLDGEFPDIDGDARLPAPGEEVEADYGADEYIPDPKMAVAPKKKLKFRTTIVGEHRDEALTITNKGQGPLTVWSIASDQTEFIVEPDDEVDFPQVINPGGGLEITVRFAPTEKGKKKGNLLIQSNDPKKSELKVKLRGKAK